MHTLTPEFNFAGFTFPRYIADLPIGKNAMKKKRELRKVCGGYYHAPKPGGSGGWGFYHESRDGASFDLRIEETGDSYNADEHTEFHAIVARLNHGRGFLVGWTMGAGMASSLDSDVFTDEDDARRTAKIRAQDAAEQEAEYLAEEQARMDAEDLDAEMEGL